MTTFVLVPGAWLGGWCWRRVRPLLAGQGHSVVTPTLTGLGERSHLASSGVDLETHIQDVVNVVAWEDLREVVLVGHSYSGFVVAGVADRASDRIAKLVFLDTVIPVDGQAFLDLWSPEGRAVVEVAATENGGGWPMPDDLGEDAADLTDEDARWLRSKASPQPLGTLTQPLRLSNASTASVPRAYIC
ncbi:MAG TPA: alpha/beta fold hydrolase [Thermomicrobiales bacterium]|nr:alpha/beta fold hydrolase [Thermomicrobiales bacterium]